MTEAVCQEKTGTGWHRRNCGKPAFETIGKYSFCKMHAKHYRIRNHMETGEDLQTRFLISSGAIFRCEGVASKKIFAIRKSEVVFGKGYLYQSRTDIDDKALLETLEEAKNSLAQGFRDEIINLRREIAITEERLKELEQS